MVFWEIFDFRAVDHSTGQQRIFNLFHPAEQIRFECSVDIGHSGHVSRLNEVIMLRGITLQIVQFVGLIRQAIENELPLRSPAAAQFVMLGENRIVLIRGPILLKGGQKIVPRQFVCRIGDLANRLYAICRYGPYCIPDRL